MTDKANKDKLGRGLSLSRGKKKGGVKAGSNASPATSATPITSFFSNQPPPKLACPLCGQFVPRFKINEHIDLQCKNFERGDSSAPSASTSVVQSAQLSPTRNPLKSSLKSPLKSPASCPNKDKEETKTSPYFKKNGSNQAPREISNKNVVRTIDLGSLSAKLSRKCPKTSERRQMVEKPAQTEKEIDSETLNSSQKENQLIEGLEDKKDCPLVIDLTVNNADTPTAAVDVSCPHTEHSFDHKTKSDQITPELNLSSFKLSKRKKETTSSGRKLSFSKRAKHEGERSRDAEEASSSDQMEETADPDQPKTEVPCAPATTSDPPPSSAETSEKSAADIKSDSLPEVGPGDQAVDGAQPPRLPYYLRNFRTVLQAVLENEDDRALFDQHDMSHVHAFERLSGMQTHC